MDILAALALVMVIEGLAATIFAASLPELLAALKGVGPRQMRLVGIVMTVTGAMVYLMIRT